MKKQNARNGDILLLIFAFCLMSFIGVGQKSLTGKVTDRSGEALIGATISVKATTVGTITDVDGNYQLALPEGASVLVVSYTGYAKQEIDINGQSVIDVTLDEASELLDELVVIGYARQTKSVVTGAVSSIKVDELNARSPGQLQSNIQGKVSGISITPTSGAPDAGFKVKIRGTGSNGPTEPLYIVDGMRTRDIRFLEGNAIKSLEVLKDAASASIYGAEGANGVILITTKNGTSGHKGINYSVQYGSQSYRGNMELMTADQWSQYLRDAESADVNTSGVTTTNWIDEIFQSAPTTRHSLSFNGGSENTSYYLGGSYFNQSGILGGSDFSDFTRSSVNLGINTRINERVTAGANLTYANEKSVGSSQFGDQNVGGIISSVILMDPTTPVSYTGSLPQFVTDLGDVPLQTDADGNPYGLSNVTTGEIINPFISLSQINGDGTNVNRMFGSANIAVDLLDNLTFVSRGGIDLNNGTFHNWSPTYYANATRNSTAASAIFNNFNVTGTQWENFLTYDMNVSGNTNLQLLAGQSIFGNTVTTLNANASGLISEIQEVSYVDGSESASSVRGNKSEQRLSSYFGRATLNISDKYLFMASLRRDGTSLFIPENRWKTYPGISAGWIISREDFFGSSAINFMKLRASWGQAGSLAGAQPGSGQSFINFLYRFSDADGNFTTIGETSSLDNPDLTWETSEQVNIGMDFGLLEDRFTISADYFNKLTKDLIVQGTPPGFIGNNAPLINAGTMSNKGFELELNYNNRDNELKYQITANLTSLKNEVTKLNSDDDIIQGSNSQVGTNWTASAFEVGQPAWYFRGFETNGLNEDGTPNIVDISGDGEITPDDYTFIGSPHPSMLFGFGVNLEYKNFDFTLFAQGQTGNDILMGFNRTDRGEGNKPTVFLEDDFFAPSIDGNGYTSDFMVFDGSFVRLKQIQFGYNFENLLNSIENVRLYLSIDDYFTFTSYPGLDPEIGSSFNDAIGIDRGVYPIPGRILIGASVNF